MRTYNRKIAIYSNDINCIEWIRKDIHERDYDIEIFSNKEYSKLYEDNSESDPLILVSDLDEFIDFDEIQLTIGSLLKVFPYIFIIGFSTTKVNILDERFIFVDKAFITNILSFSIFFDFISGSQNRKIELRQLYNFPEKITLEITDESYIKVKIINLFNEALSLNYPCDGTFHIPESDIEKLSSIVFNDNLGLAIEWCGKALFERLIQGNKSLFALLGTSSLERPLSTNSIEIRTNKDLLRVPFETLYYERPQNKSFFYALDRPLTRLINKEKIGFGDISLESYSKKDVLRILLVGLNPNKDLEFVEREIDELEELINAEFSKFSTVEVDKVNETGISQKDLFDLIHSGKYDILHYAGHSVFNGDNPNESGFYIGNKTNLLGQKTAINFTTRNLQDSLKGSGIKFAFLNSCRSAQFSDTSKLFTNKFLGLSDTFLQCGVQTLLGYRWNIDDSEAYHFAKNFYLNLAIKKDFGKALLESREKNKYFNSNTCEWASSMLIKQDI